MIQTDRYADTLIEIIQDFSDDEALRDYAEAHLGLVGLMERAYATLPAFERC